MRRLVLPTVLAAALALTASAPTASYGVPERAASGPERFVLQGHGWGHGHGMSQYGAEGAALAGVSYRQILRFYYPGTKRGTERGKVSVLVSGDTSGDVVVRDRAGLTLTALGSGKRMTLHGAKPAARWRIGAASPTTSRVQWRARTGGWRTWRIVQGDAQFSAGGPMRLVTPAGVVGYRGILRSATAKPGTTKRDTVNIVPLDTYLRGVVPSEVIAGSWQPDALRAQAVAARTYAAYERRHPIARHYQICDTSQCQVYTGTTHEYPTTDAAIRRTRGEVLTHGGAPAFTQFSSSNGGWTRAGSFPYLPAKQDPYDATPTNPNHSWRHVVPASAVEAAWPSLGDVTAIKVLERDGHGDWGGRVVRVKVVGAQGLTTVSGDTLRSYLGLRSDWFKVAR